MTFNVGAECQQWITYLTKPTPPYPSLYLSVHTSLCVCIFVDTHANATNTTDRMEQQTKAGVSICKTNKAVELRQAYAVCKC